MTPRIGFGSLSGESDGFDYSGSSESVSLALDIGRAAWQAGLVAAATRTDLTYQAEAALRSRGYASGDHETELFSLHPFAAWHAPSGGHVWGSLGAGSGTLRHRDDARLPVLVATPTSSFAPGPWAPRFPWPTCSPERFRPRPTSSRSPSTSRAATPSRPRSPPCAAPTGGRGLRGAHPFTGAPALSVAYKRLTGDGPEGTRMEAAGSVAFAGLLDPPSHRVRHAPEASFGLGDYEQDSWQSRRRRGLRLRPPRARRSA